MINENLGYGEALSVAAGGFESTMHPHWVVQFFWPANGLGHDMWVDACPQWYNEDAIGSNGYSVKMNPEFLRDTVLAELRRLAPDKKFRMVMRVEMQKALDF